MSVLNMSRILRANARADARISAREARKLLPGLKLTLLDRGHQNISGGAATQLKLLTELKGCFAQRLALCYASKTACVFFSD